MTNLSFAAESKSTVTILALGDSTTAGTPYFQSPLESPPEGRGFKDNAYGYWIEQSHAGWQVLNYGVSGERSDQILARTPAALQTQPSVAIVLAGVNDLYQGYPVEWAEDHLKKIYAMMSEKNIRVVACSVLPYNASTDEVRRKMAELNDWIAAYCRSRGFIYFDGFHLLENPEAPGTLTASPDGLHPDRTGYRKLGEGLADLLEKNV